MVKRPGRYFVLRNRLFLWLFFLFFLPRRTPKFLKANILEHIVKKLRALAKLYSPLRCVPDVLLHDFHQ